MSFLTSAPPFPFVFLAAAKEGPRPVHAGCNMYLQASCGGSVSSIPRMMGIMDNDNGVREPPLLALAHNIGLCNHPRAAVVLLPITCCDSGRAVLPETPTCWESIKHR
ncbi:hypothetical protein E2562_017492 [Oryza meyeriana var. granulata]|uniref:Uncharacterized protein n=1 Tax=Oryza meyeriana var. granulata TaxID=110450 RepID=A0A6G1DXW7_9ORYZ|nr:hypothetical protein E2562_017492 [Oryza meyeriana var. granulata]